MEIFGLISVPFWLIALTFILVSYIIYMSKDHGKFKAQGIKGPTPIPVLGNITTLTKLGLVLAERKWYQQYGDVFGIFEGKIPVLMVANPDMLREIFVKQFSNFHYRRIAIKQRNLSPTARNMMTLLDDEDHWRHIRSCMSPTFSGGKLKKMTSLINGACQRLVNNLQKKVDKKEEIEIKIACGQYTMDVTASVAFGIQIDSQENPNDPFVVNANKFFEIKAWIITVLLFFPFIVDVLGWFGKSILATGAMKFFCNVVDRTIEERERSKDTSQRDFLQLMIEQEEASNEGEGRKEEQKEKTDGDSQSTWTSKGLNRDEIHAQAALFFAAGFETTSATISIIIYILATQESALNRVLDEIDRIVGQGDVTYDQLAELTYMDQVIQETQRLYPAGSRIDRTCTHTTTINGIRIDEGDIIAIPIAAIHRNPEFWPDPEKFDPERFTPERKAERNVFHFMPFGHGPRNCIGMRLALMELKMGLVAVLQKFKPVKGPRTQEKPEVSKIGFLRINGGAWIYLENRNHEA